MSEYLSIHPPPRTNDQLKARLEAVEVKAMANAVWERQDFHIRRRTCLCSSWWRARNDHSTILVLTPDKTERGQMRLSGDQKNKTRHARVSFSRHPWSRQTHHKTHPEFTSASLVVVSERSQVPRTHIQAC